MVLEGRFPTASRVQTVVRKFVRLAGWWFGLFFTLEGLVGLLGLGIYFAEGGIGVLAASVFGLPSGLVGLFILRRMWISRRGDEASSRAGGSVILDGVVAVALLLRGSVG